VGLRFEDLAFTLGPRRSRLRCLAAASEGGGGGGGGGQNEGRQVLREVSGSCGLGQLTALLGPSGSGKTSLLDIVAGRKSAGAGASFSGSVSVGGKELSPAQRRRRITYVLQEDILCSTDTVGDVLEFVAALALHRLPQQQRHRHVERVMHELGLQGKRDTQCGAASEKGLSGGERRRVGIAAALLRCIGGGAGGGGGTTSSTSVSTNAGDDDDGSGSGERGGRSCLDSREKHSKVSPEDKRDRDASSTEAEAEESEAEAEAKTKAVVETALAELTPAALSSASNASKTAMNAGEKAGVLVCR